MVILMKRWMKKNRSKGLLSLFFLFIFSGCASKMPVTWEARVVNHQPNEVDLVYNEYGNNANKTLLFLHGFGESRYTWRFIVGELSKKYHIVIVDLKGFGESPKNEDDSYSVYDHAHIINGFIIKHHLNNLTIVGRSFGGGIALVLALMQGENLLQKKRIEGLILIDSMSYQQQLPSMLKTLNRPIIGYLGIHLLSNEWMAKEAYRYAFTNDSLISKDSVDYSVKMLSLPNAKYAYLQTVNTLIPDDIATMEKKYSTITLPTLLLWGRDDVSIRLDKAYRLHRALPHNKLIILRGVGHMPQEEVPLKVIKAIDDFMETSLK